AVALRGERGTTPTALATDQQGRCGIGLASLAAVDGKVDIGTPTGIDELQSALADVQAAQLDSLSVAFPQEAPVARLAFAWRGLQQHRRTGEAYFRQLHAAAQQRPQADVDLDPVGAGRVRLLGPSGIGERDAVAAAGAGAAEADVQVADVQGTTGACLRRTFQRAFEPVPVPQQQQRNYGRDDEADDDQRAPAGRARAQPLPARCGRCGGGRGRVHAAHGGGRFVEDVRKGYSPAVQTAWAICWR